MMGIGIPELVIIAFVLLFLFSFGRRIFAHPTWVPPAAPRAETDDRLTRLEDRMTNIEGKLAAIERALSTDSAPTGHAAGEVTGDLREAVLDLIRQNRKIEAIKVYRERTGAGLKEAKDAVDAMERG